MAFEDLLGDGNVKVTAVLTLSSTSAPPAAELNAGIDLQMLLTKDGLGIEPSQASVDNGALGSRSNTSRGGTSTYNITLTYKRKQLEADDIAYNTLTPKLDIWLAVRRNKAHELPYVAGDPVEIYPSECGIYQRQPPVLDEVQKIVQQMFNHSDADTEATVAA
ncbi:hypothetical protein HD597_010091 [Nonomuraea thailandensis]|uniref:Uncharacterized protein n=1 Tax=Nonomuraea thailandensis TaxID=1188745 RepID=A0A9X2KAL0_9ACTN|nr:hypothetical protein [Nonomuraea thailandensis]MCP2363071.1 hypothetical protein [Nonomuraea thailandensis]